MDTDLADEPGTGAKLGMSARSHGLGSVGDQLTRRQMLSYALKLVGSVIHVDGIAPSILEVARQMPDLASLTDENRQAVISKAESMLQS